MFLLVVVLGFVANGVRLSKFLPGATPLIFDADQAPLKPIKIEDLHTQVWQGYSDVQIHHFRRLPITLTIPVHQLQTYRRSAEKGLVSSSRLILDLSVELKEDVGDSLVLLLERSRFGGVNGIRHDTSNFCDWLHSENRRVTSVSIGTDLVDGKISSYRNSASEEYVLYLGFSGASAKFSRTVGFEIAAKLTQEQAQSHTPACTAFEKFDQPPSSVHIRRKVSEPSLSVLTRDIVLRKWTDLPTSEEIIGPSTPTVEAKMAKSAFSITLQPNHIFALGIDVPSVPESVERWAPTLTLLGLPEGAADVLIGSYKAQSVWELQRFEQFAQIHDTETRGPRTWAVPLRGVITHLQSHQGFLSPPGTSLLVLILPRLRIPLKLEGQLLMMSPHHALEADPVIIVTDSPSSSSQSIFFACFGIAAGVGIVHAVWLVVTRVQRRAARQPLFIYDADTAPNKERVPLVTVTPDPSAPDVVAYDISSHPGETHRSAGSS